MRSENSYTTSVNGGLRVKKKRFSFAFLVEPEHFVSVNNMRFMTSHCAPRPCCNMLRTI